MSGVLFLKESSYINAQYSAQHNPNTYFYAFNYEGRNSLFTYFFLNSGLPFPHGKVNKLTTFNKIILIRIAHFEQNVIFFSFFRA